MKKLYEENDIIAIADALRTKLPVKPKNLFYIGSSLDEYFYVTNDGKRISSYSVSETKIQGTFTKDSFTSTYYNDSSWGWIAKFVDLPKNTDVTWSGYVSQVARVFGSNSNEVGTSGTQLLVLSAGWSSPKTFNTGDYEYYWICFYPPKGKDFRNIQLEVGPATEYENPLDAKLTFKVSEMADAIMSIKKGD